jgi:hypothetical protein
MRPDPSMDLTNATDDQIANLKAMSDDDLIPSARSVDLSAVVESTRRLREALHKEERAISRLYSLVGRLHHRSRRSHPGPRLVGI